jgi:hypothetical protein
MHTAIVMNKRKVNLSKIVVSNKSYMDPNVVKLKREREREREWRWKKCSSLGQSGYAIINHEYFREEVGISDMNTTVKSL